MEVNEVIKLVGGRIFSVTYIKKDGTVRKLNGRRGVKKGVKGVGMSYNPTEKDLLVAFDMRIREFRMVNVRTILEIKANKEHYLVKEGVVEKQ